ncbi:MAB_1171c family putative transporter [Streptomyces sp. NPDC001552]|uniref:MAB_1171c family putative transporter n=1 Tax=Streptomyces sp. NPDC001552 TaxID=3364587 RepID=UPI00367DF4E5
MEGSDYYIPAAILIGAFLLKGPVLVRRWRDPMVRAVSGLLLLGGAGFAPAAPPTVLVVNRAAGVPNLSAPLVHATLSGFSTWCLVLLAYWREGPGAAARRQVRSWSWVCAAVVTAIGAFFALGDAPVERLQDLDTHYASMPYLREMITMYLAWHFVVAVVMAVTCLRWSKHVDGWLRASLRMLVAAFALDALFAVLKSTAVGTRWAGGNLDGWSTDLAPGVAGVGAVLTAIGFLLPQGERISALWSAWRTYRLLGPLWRRLRAVAQPDSGLGAPKWWRPAEKAPIHRETDLQDWLHGLAPYCMRPIMTDTIERASRTGRSTQHAWDLGAATMIHHAIESARKAQHSHPTKTLSTGIEALAPILGAGSHGMARVAHQYSVLARHSMAA